MSAECSSSFEEFERDWQRKEDLYVNFLDPKRTIGVKGIQTERKSPAQRALEETKARIEAEQKEEDHGAGL